MSGLFVDSIKDASNTKTLATLSSSSVTLHSDVVFPAGGTGNPISVAIVHEQQASSDGGTFNSGDWRKRSLNTEVSDIDSIVTVDTTNKQFTIGAGSYFFQFGAIGYKVGHHQTKLYNATDSVDAGMGILAYGNTSYNQAQTSMGFAFQQPSGSIIYELQHRSAESQSSNGRGPSSSWGSGSSPNVYSFVVIYKLK